jgi:polo-like kinase 1
MGEIMVIFCYKKLYRVDYSSKYGLGYILCNGCTGVYFNDSTKIILEQGSDHFRYFERRSNKKDMMTEYTTKDYPEDL